MANLKCKIVLRLPRAERRKWVEPSGQNDPPGVYHLRYYAGKTMKHERVAGDFHDAEIAQLKLERKLLLASHGIEVPAEEAPDTKILHRCTETLDKYILMLASAVKRNGRRYSERSNKARKVEVQEFLKHCGRVYIEQITRADILAYKAHLYENRKANDTVLKKMMRITTWLKRNPVVSISGLLKAEDWPTERKTEAHPFSDKEVQAMLGVAQTYQETLLIRLMYASGMRKGEAMHLEFEDVDDAGCIWIRDKPYWKWQTKTPASVRTIPIDVDLITELKALGKTGLIFKSKSGRPLRIGRILARIGKDAGVRPPVDDRASWCHRWRDSYATDKVREKVHDHRDIAKFLGHENEACMSLYAEFVRLDSDDTRKSAAHSNRFAPKKPGPRLVSNG